MNKKQQHVLQLSHTFMLILITTTKVKKKKEDKTVNYLNKNKWGVHLLVEACLIRVIPYVQQFHKTPLLCIRILCDWD